MAGRPEREEEASWVPPESAPLAGLGKVNERVVQAMAAHDPARRATLDMDASITESAKREAYGHYKEGRGSHGETPTDFTTKSIARHGRNQLTGFA